MTEKQQRHVPVLFQEAIDFLRVRAAARMLTARWAWQGTPRELPGGWGREGQLIGFDRDPEALELAKARLERVSDELGSEAPQ